MFFFFVIVLSFLFLFFVEKNSMKTLTMITLSELVSAVVLFNIYHPKTNENTLLINLFTVLKKNPPSSSDVKKFSFFSIACSVNKSWRHYICRKA